MKRGDKNKLQNRTPPNDLCTYKLLLWGYCKCLKVTYKILIFIRIQAGRYIFSLNSVLSKTHSYEVKNNRMYFLDKEGKIISDSIYIELRENREITLVVSEVVSSPAQTRDITSKHMISSPIDITQRGQQVVVHPFQGILKACRDQRPFQ